MVLVLALVLLFLELLVGELLVGVLLLLVLLLLLLLLLLLPLLELDGLTAGEVNIIGSGTSLGIVIGSGLVIHGQNWAPAMDC